MDSDPDPASEIYYLHLDIPIGIVQLVIIFLFKINSCKINWEKQGVQVSTKFLKISIKKVRNKCP